MGKANAIVVLCPHRPSLLGQPLLGHVAWGYEYPNGEWLIGAVEGPDWRGGLNGFWAVKRPNLRSALMYFAKMKEQGAEYNCYKLLTVTPRTHVSPEYADQMVRWISQQKYELFGRNCMNSAYDVLRAFCNGKYNFADLPHPNGNWIPNGWFNAIQTHEYYKLPTKYSALQLQDNIVEFDLNGEVSVPEWRKRGSELEIITHSDVHCVDHIEVKLPTKLQYF